MALADQGSNRQEKQCDICLRCFARTEHLARHRRTHTKEKPFSCPYCPRTFQRSDVKASHVKNCHAAPAGLTAGNAADDASSSKRARVACDPCRKLKTRCDGQEPCARCQASGRTCGYSTGPPLASAASSHTLPEDNRGLVSQQRDSDSAAAFKEQTSLFPLDAKPAGLPFESSPLTHTGLYQPPQVPYLPYNYSAPINDGSLVGGLDMSLSHLDTDMMDTFWPLPMMNTQFWFGEPEIPFTCGLPDTNTLLPDHGLSSTMQKLTSTMQDYFDRKSREPSPSTNKQSKKWYSAQPDMRNHSHDVIRVFLGLFRRHIPRTFSIFNDAFHNPATDRIYLMLAMAATGGLFCSVEGSAEVAKVLYNDARRLVLAFFNLRNDSFESTATHEDYLVTAKTFILLSIYGLCSGDKRLYEFVEAFHADLVYTISEYSEACRRAPWSQSTLNHSAKLLEALQILDCYRVIIMTRPPSLSWHPLAQLALDSPHQGKLHQLHHQTSNLISGARTMDPESGEEFSLATLASLATVLWPAVYPSQNRYDIDSVIFEGSSLGKPDFAALACDNWLSQKHPIEPNTLAMYHMMNIMLHANVTTLMYFAHAGPDSPARDPDRSALAREVYGWNRDGNGKIARWHAKSLMSTIEGAVTPPPPTTARIEVTSAVKPSDARRLPFEAPHVPYVVYYATLVLWCAAACAQGEAGHAHAHIVRAERILSLHRVRIAQILARVLNEIR